MVPRVPCTVAEPFVQEEASDVSNLHLLSGEDFCVFAYLNSRAGINRGCRLPDCLFAQGASLILPEPIGCSSQHCPARARSHSPGDRVWGIFLRTAKPLLGFSEPHCRRGAR